MSKAKKSTIDVLGTTITILAERDEDYISLTDMLKAKDGDFFYFGLAAEPQHRRVSRNLGAGPQSGF